MQLVFPVVFLLVSLKWGKWRNWQQYYPTILFMITGNLLYCYMFKEYPMWRFEHTFEEAALPTVMSIDLLKTFTSFPLLTLMYLSYYPEGNIKKKFLYIVMWTALFGIIEYIARLLDMISYHHGWSLWWSLLFDISMFTLLAIHYKRPIMAWLLSGVLVVFLWKLFNLNFNLLN